MERACPRLCSCKHTHQPDSGIAPFIEWRTSQFDYIEMGDEFLWTGGQLASALEGRSSAPSERAT